MWPPSGSRTCLSSTPPSTSPRRRALLTALVVVFFDVSLALACFFGVGAVMEAFPAVGMVVLLVGSVIVLAIGIGLLRTKAATDKSGQEGPWPTSPGPKQPSPPCGHLGNPQALIDGTGRCWGLSSLLPAAQSAPFIGGVGLASCLWFTGVTLVISLFRRKFTPRSWCGSNRVCGAVILVYGGRLLQSFLSALF